MHRNLICDPDVTVHSEERMDYSIKDFGTNGYPYAKKQKWWPKKN